MKKVYTFLACALALSANATLVNHLTFDDPDDLFAPTVGNRPVEKAAKYVDVSDSLCYAVTDSEVLHNAPSGAIAIPRGRLLSLDHGLGSDPHNEWCAVMRVYMPSALAAGTYWCLYSLNQSNGTDGYLFYKAGGFGGTTGGWNGYAGGELRDAWHTVVVSVSASGQKLYVDDLTTPVQSTSSSNQRFSGSRFLIAADDSGEDNLIYFDDFKLYDETEPDEVFKSFSAAIAPLVNFGDRVKFTGALADTGDSGSSVDVYFAYCLDGGALGAYTLVKSGWTVDEAFSYTLSGLSPETSYDYSFKLVNSSSAELVIAGDVDTVRDGASWVYTPGSGTMTDGDWILRMEDYGNGRLGVYWVEPSTPSGLTKLDLSGMVVDSAGNEYTVPVLTSNAFSERAPAADLETLILPDRLEKIERYCFRKVPLRHVSPFLPVTCTNIALSAFEDTQITNALSILSTAPVTLGEDIFWNKSKNGMIPSAVLGTGVNNIPKGMFYGQSALESVELLGAVTNIGNIAFSDCTSLRSFTPFLPNTLRSLGIQAFIRCRNLSGGLSIGWTDAAPLTIQYHSDGVFEAGLSLETVCIGPAVTNDLHRSDFWGDTSIREIYLAAFLPDAVGNDASGVDVRRGVFGNMHINGNGDYKTRFHICRSVLPQWQSAYLDDPSYFTAWDDLAPEEKAAYTSEYPNERLPIGLGLKPLFGWKQWVLSYSSEFDPMYFPGMLIVVH